MSTPGGVGVERDAQWAASLQTAIETVVEQRVRDINTSMPGTVKAFDATNQTATVEPAFKILLVDGTEKQVPPLVMVPVYFPTGGGFTMTFPVVPGDECLLVFSQRAIDSWWYVGGPQLPDDHRFHDLSDACAFVGIRSSKKALSPPISTDGVEIRNDSQTILVRVDGSGVTLGQITGAAPLLLGDSATLTWLAAVGTGSGAGPPPPTMVAVLVKGK